MNEDKTSIQQNSSQWAEILGQLFDRLTGKGASVTYSFDNLVVDIPKAQGPGGQDMGSARWTVNGKIVITAEAYASPEQAQQPRSTISTAA
ncbi:MAG: hypothetical protein ABI361_02305 [Nitrososphaera sp.]|jgi:hypothetical protein